VVHRDIKPHNILLDERSGAMLTDFGFARLVGTSSLTQSLSGGIVGTPAYIAPEIWEGVDATQTTDVYALACVAYEMLSGETLFSGKTPMVVMRAHDRGAQLPEEWPIDIPPDIGGIMERALSRSPDERYPNVPQFLGALEDLQTAAVEQRIAARVDQLLDRMRDALDVGKFEEAVTAGKELLELQSDHEAGARLLGEAQSRLSKKQELVARLEQRKTSLEAEQEELLTEKADLTEQIAELEAQVRKLVAERAELEAQLRELDQIRSRSERDKAQKRQRLRSLEKRFSELEQHTEHFNKVSKSLESGDLEQAEQMIRQLLTSHAHTESLDSAEELEEPDESSKKVDTDQKEKRQQRPYYLRAAN
jgi:hypothetical protein